MKRFFATLVAACGLAVLPATAFASPQLLPDVIGQSIILAEGSQPNIWNGGSWNTTGPSPIAYDVSDDRNQVCTVTGQWLSVACRKTQVGGGFQVVFRTPNNIAINDVAVGAQNGVVIKLINGAIWAQQPNGQWAQEIRTPNPPQNPGQLVNGFVEAIDTDYCVALEPTQTTVTVTCRTIGQAGAPVFATTVNGTLQDFDMAKDTVFLVVRDPATGRINKHQWTVSTRQPFVMPAGVTPNFSNAVISPDGFTVAWDELNPVALRFDMNTWDTRTSQVVTRASLNDPLVLGFDTNSNLWTAPALGRWTFLPAAAGLPAGWNGPIQLP